MASAFPPYTQENYDTLAKAIASGAKRVKYGNKEVEYQALSEMRALLAEMAAALGYIKPNSGRTFAEFSRD